MNDIASVEFEAHVPLFFDAYASNRSTGSFILIDTISNATVGAGMIEEAVSAEPRLEASELASLEIEQKRVSAQERYERHGHYPATFLLEGQPTVASRLERALFEQGFEVLHIDDNDASFYVLSDVIRAAHRIGALFIYSGRALDTEEKQQLASQTFRLHDLSQESEKFDQDELFRRALVLADSLRLAKAEENQERPN